MQKNMARDFLIRIKKCTTPKCYLNHKIKIKYQTIPIPLNDSLAYLWISKKTVSSSYSSPWLGAVKNFRPTFLAFPTIPHHCPFTPVEPGYGVDLFEDDYLFLLPAADLKMDIEVPSSLFGCVRLPR
jgi:hypothetical protein